MVAVVAFSLMLCPFAVEGVNSTDDLEERRTTTNFTIHYTDEFDTWPNDAVSLQRAVLFGTQLEGIRSDLLSYGFDDPGFTNVYVYHRPDSPWNAFGGGRDSRVMGFDSYYLGNDWHLGQTASQIEQYTVPSHEMLHTIQYGYYYDNDMPGPFPRDWILEGQARMLQDKLIDAADHSDGSDMASYLDEVYGYLMWPSRSLLDASYAAALFWTYVTEQYGAITTEPDRGLDAVVEFWEAAEDIGCFNDELAVFDRMLDNLGHPDVTFKDVFMDFVVSCYAKDLTGPSVPDKYQYIDETQVPGSYFVMGTSGYGFVVDEIPADGAALAGQDFVKCWMPKYYRYSRDLQSTDVIQVDVNGLSDDDLFITMLVVNNDDIVAEYRVVGAEFSRSLELEADEVVLIVAGLDNRPSASAKYVYSMRAGNDLTMEILEPLNDHPARVGPNDNPEKFLIVTQVLDGAEFVTGLTHTDFEVVVGAEDATVLDCAYVKGLYFLEVQAPAQTALGDFDLEVTFTYASDVSPDSVVYSADDAIDSVIVIDRSGSMGNDEKIDAAQAAARLYVNSFLMNDMLALVQFNHDADLLHGMGTVSTIRSTILDSIDAIVTGGLTSIGDGLFCAQNEVFSNGDVDNPDHIILLTDGRENTAKMINDVRWLLLGNDTVLDVVLVGIDAQAENLQNLARWTGGNSYLAFDPSSGWLNSYLANFYRSTAERIRGDQRIYSTMDEATGTWSILETFRVDPGSVATVVFSYRADNSVDAGSVSLLGPDNTPISQTFIRSKVASSTEHFGHILWSIPNPDIGMYTLNASGMGEIEYYIEAGLHGLVSMQMHMDLAQERPLIGEVVPIIATLSDNGPILGADVVATVSTGASFTDIQSWELNLYDDGAHSDGLPNDGVYGNLFTRTGGLGSLYNESVVTYNVRARASGESGIAGEFNREVLGGFYLLRDPDYDQDHDNLPDVWEEHFGLDSALSAGDDGQAGDPDRDGLTNYDELLYGTSPINTDTDGGGESDESEVTHGRDPYDRSDDTIRPPMIYTVPGNGEATVIFFTNLTFSSIDIFRSEEADTGYSEIALGIAPTTASYTDDTVSNGNTYYYVVRGTDAAGAISGLSSAYSVTPKSDVTAPHGHVIINDNERYTTTSAVTLTISASDDTVDMRVSMDPLFEEAPWITYSESLSWDLPEEGLQIVFLQFRDSAGNIGGFAADRTEGTPSEYAFDGIIFDPDYVPPPDSQLLIYILVGSGVVVLALVVILYIRKFR
jgi:hypothetical protein